MFAAGDNSKEPLYAPKIIVDANQPTTTTLLTTASLSVRPDYPFSFIDVPGSLQLRGTGGIWGLPVADSWAIVDENNTDNTALVVDTQPSGGSRVAIGVDPAVSTGTATLTIGPGGNVGSGEATHYLILRDYLGVNALTVDRDGNTNVLGNLTSQADITAGTNIFVDDVTINDSGMDIISGNVAISNGNVTISSGTVVVNVGRVQVVNGSIVSNAGTTFTDPQVAIIALADGGIAGFNIGAQEDVHAGISMYPKRSIVVGRGAQHFGHDGAVVITSNGSETAPYPGFGRASIYTDQNGVRYTILDSASPYRGSIGSGHNFDADILTSGGLETSSTIKAGGDITAPSFIGSGESLTGIPKLVFVNTAGATISDTTSLENFVITGNGSQIIGANTVSAGTTYEVTVYGTTFSSDSSPNSVVIYLQIGSVVIAQTASIQIVDVSVPTWCWKSVITVADASASGSVFGGHDLNYYDQVLLSNQGSAGLVSGSGIDFTADQTLNVAAQLSVASIDIGVSVASVIIKRLN